MSRQFVEDSIVGARVVGIYGMAGLGKTMLAKAMHDYFYGEFLGKVCYIDMRNGSRARRQKWMLRMLCGFEKDVVDCIGDDVEKGLMQMKTFMKRERVFLVIDNITFNAHLLQEVQDYLTMGFHSESKIMITSSSKAILEDLLPNKKLYTPMPTLMVEEAGVLFLKRAAPMKAISKLTSEEHKILGICIQKCWFPSPKGGLYHPVALTALADFFSRLGRAKENQLLVWKDHLEKEMDLVNDVLKSSTNLFGILGLQFSTFDFSEKLVFLDIALYSGHSRNKFFRSGGDHVRWLCRLHDESSTNIGRKVLDLRKSGMIYFDHLEIIDYDFDPLERMNYTVDIKVPPLYKEFAKWYATNHNVNPLKNAWGVFQPGGTNLGSDPLTPIKCWSNLIRLRIFPMTPINARLIASKKMQELSNLVVLQLFKCDNLTMLNLEGLDCLRHLELFGLSKLVSITLSKNSNMDEYVGIYDSLQHVRLSNLLSLVHMPDLRPCTSLHSIALEGCYEVKNLEGADCPCVKELFLNILTPYHFEGLLDFDCLESLEELSIHARSDIDHFQAQWNQRVDESYKGVEITLKGEGPCAKLLEELCLLFDRSSNMVCRFFSSFRPCGSVILYDPKEHLELMEMFHLCT